MKATEILMEEHRVIERVLTALETAIPRLAPQGNVQAVFFITAAEFIKGFADGCHHKKEEGVLFQAMVENGLPSDSGPISVMLSEHDQGRRYTRAMLEAAQRLAAGDESAREAVLQNAAGYAALLREHIAKEDNILFPMANSVIPLAAQDRLADDFERIENEEAGAGVHEKYLALAESLEKAV
jgi:hemerythrin-like domain-containing protein